MSYDPSLSRFHSVPAKPPNPAFINLGKYLVDAYREPSEENVEKLKFVLNDSGVAWTSENIESAIQVLGTKLTPLRKPKPLARTVSVEELCEMLAKVLDANKSWLADTEKNGAAIAEEFYSERTPPTKSIQDMVAAVTRISAHLERVPPPVYQPPQYEEPPLESWQLPLEAPDFQIRAASKEAIRDLVKRRQARDAWRKEQGL